MKAFLFLLPLLGLALGHECQCPQVKCPTNNAADYCQCLNYRETLCHERCPDYVPLYRPCPINSFPPPAPTETPSLSSRKCTCDTVYCPMIWPQACYCRNDADEACYKKCGGKKPVPQNCGSTTTLSTKTKPTSTRPPTSPTGVNPPCGGGRGNYVQCADGYVCIKDPSRPGCGPECDGPGICVKDKLCGGFAGFSCDVKGQTCIDDPRDDCDPKKGGADCGGLCAWQ